MPRSARKIGGLPELPSKLSGIDHLSKEKVSNLEAETLEKIETFYDNESNVIQLKENKVSVDVLLCGQDLFEVPKLKGFKYNNLGFGYQEKHYLYAEEALYLWQLGHIRLWDQETRPLKTMSEALSAIQALAPQKEQPQVIFNYRLFTYLFQRGLLLKRAEIVTTSRDIILVLRNVLEASPEKKKRKVESSSELATKLRTINSDNLWMAYNSAKNFSTKQLDNPAFFILPRNPSEVVSTTNPFRSLLPDHSLKLASFDGDSLFLFNWEEVDLV